MLDILELLCNTEVGDMGGGSIEPTPEPSTVDSSVGSVETAPEPSNEVEEPSLGSEISKYNIDGEELTVEQIRELRSNAKTYKDVLAEQQRITRMGEEHKDAIELFNYLKNKPELTQKLYELDSTLTNQVKTLDPMSEKVASIENRFKMMDIERQLDSIVSKDNSVTKGELLKEATESRCDIQTAYNIWRGKNFDKTLQAKLNEQSKQLTQKIKSNAQVTKTAISNGDTLNKGDISFGLSDVEQAMAKKLGMTFEDYSKWKL